MGQKFILHVICILLIFGCIVIAGCSDLLTAEGPLTKYAFSSRTSRALALTHAPVPTITTQTTPLSGTLVPEQTPSIAILATPTEDPYSYHPLRVTPVAGDTVEYRTFSFRYRTDGYTITVPVNTSIYRAANTSGNKQLINDDDRKYQLFYQQMVADPAMEPFYDDILTELRKLRYKGGKTLTDDEYLEMIVSFVQKIPYDDRQSGGVRYPVEVIYDQKGDCDEKSILLTGLLSREGYDVGLLLFPSLKHATAGIRIHLATNNPSFRVFSDGNRDYVYIETTATRLIGFYPDEYKNAPQPIIVPVGTGTLNYGKVNYVMSILYDLGTIRTNIKTLEERAAANNNVLQKWYYDAYLSYIKTSEFVESTNDREAAMKAIRESELPHQSSCMSCD
jgi:hypothetical protein